MPPKPEDKDKIRHWPNQLFEIRSDQIRRSDSLMNSRSLLALQEERPFQDTSPNAMDLTPSDNNSEQNMEHDLTTDNSTLPNNNNLTDDINNYLKLNGLAIPQEMTNGLVNIITSHLSGEHLTSSEEQFPSLPSTSNKRPRTNDENNFKFPSARHTAKRPLKIANTPPPP
jgi:hypothetical protein